MYFYLPQVQISCWKTTMPSVNSSQKCLGVFLIHGICSTTSFLIPWFENYCYSSSNTEHVAPQNKPLVHTMQIKPSGERGSKTNKEVDGAGMGPGRKDARQASAQETRSIGLLGPGRAGTPSQLEVLEESTVMARGGWQVTLKLMRSGSDVCYAYQTDNPEIFHLLLRTYVL